MLGADRSTTRLSEGCRNAALAAFVALLGRRCAMYHD